jgi:hypothetical protein
VCQGEKGRAELGRTFVRSAPGLPLASSKMVQYLADLQCGRICARLSRPATKGRTRLLQAIIAEALLFGAMF